MGQLQSMAELATSYNLCNTTSIAHFSSTTALGPSLLWLHLVLGYIVLAHGNKLEVAAHSPLFPKVGILSHYFDNSVHPQMGVGVGGWER